MSNFIQINDMYAITSDAHQWIICKYQKEGDNADKDPARWIPMSFLSSFQNAVTELGNLMLRTGDATCLADLRADSKEIAQLLTSKVDLKIVAVSE